MGRRKIPNVSKIDSSFIHVWRVITNIILKISSVSNEHWAGPSGEIIEVTAHSTSWAGKRELLISGLVWNES